MKSEFRKEILTCFGGSFLIMFMIGIYFVYLPWNMERLNISETQLGIKEHRNEKKHADTSYNATRSSGCSLLLQYPRPSNDCFQKD